MLNLYNANNHKDMPVGKSIPVGKTPRVTFEKYVDPTGELPNKELKFGIWFVQHEVLLYKILTIILAIFGVVTIGYSFTMWGSYFLFGMAEDQKVLESISTPIDYTVINQNNAPQLVQASDTEIMPGGVDKYDLASVVTNPNAKFIFKFDYYFQLGADLKTPVQSAILLPGETKPVAYLGYDGSPESASLVMEKAEWQRVDPHEVVDPALWQNERLNFATSDFAFSRYSDPQDANSHVIKFTLINDSIYGYANADFYVGLYNEQNLVGLLPLHLEQIAAGEYLPVDLRSFAPDLEVSEVQIHPLFNVYDPQVYLAPVRD